jgi:hypothetical protein
MHFKKVILAIISVAYTLVLVHNLTPHRHSNSQNELNSESGPLNNWFNFIFGNEHEKSVQDEDHLSKFLLSDNDNCDELSNVKHSDDSDFLQSYFSDIFISDIITGFKPLTENIFLSSEKNVSCCHYSVQISGRAPPVLTII